MVDEEAYDPVEINRVFHLHGTGGVAKTKTTRTKKTKKTVIGIDDDSQWNVCGVGLCWSFRGVPLDRYGPYSAWAK